MTSPLSAVKVPIPSDREFAIEKLYHACTALSKSLAYHSNNAPQTEEMLFGNAVEWLRSAASALGLHVSAQPAAQQPSDLVRRLRDTHKLNGVWQLINPDGPEAARRIEALEAAAAQPSEREMATKEALFIAYNALAMTKFEPDSGQPHPLKDGAIDKVFDKCRKALAAYDTPAKDERREQQEAK